MLRKLISFGITSVATFAIPGAAIAQQCYTVVAYTAPSPLYCQQTGNDYLGRPIWTCCR